MVNEKGSNDMTSECLFCQIAAKKIDSSIVSETEYSLAFLDIRPSFPGHVVLIPKKHYQVMPQMEDRLIFELITHAQKISHALISGLSDDGVNGTSILISQGQVAGQKSSHFIIHVIPQTNNQRYLKWETYREEEPKIIDFASKLKEIIGSNSTNQKEQKNKDNNIDLDEITKALG